MICTMMFRPVLLYGAECWKYWTVRKKEEQILEKTEMRMLRRIEGVTLRDKVKSVGIRKELGVNSTQEKVREMRLRWYGHMQRMEENNEVRAVGDMRVPGERPRVDQEGGGWIASEGTCRNCGSPQRMPRTEHFGNQEFGPLTPPSGKRRRRRSTMIVNILFMAPRMVYFSMIYFLWSIIVEASTTFRPVDYGP